MSTAPQSALRSLESLREFDGSAKLFWSSFARTLGSIAGARRVVILMREVRAETSPTAWKRVSAWMDGGWTAVTADAEVDHRASLAMDEGLHAGPEPGGGNRCAVVAIPLKTGFPDHQCVAFGEIGPPPKSLEPAISGWSLAADVPASFRNYRARRQAESDLQHFSSTLDLLAMLHRHKRFGASVITLVNEVARRFNAQQVAVGWLEGTYVRLKAISNMESFEKKMESVQRIEAAMEEAIDQDDEILWPIPEERTRVARDHETLARLENTPHLLTIPLRLDDTPVAALTLQRSSEPFSEDDLRALRVLGDQVVQPLDHQRRRDRWWGARMKEASERKARELWSIDHAWAKAAAVLTTIALAVLFLGKMDYRVEASFLVKSREQVLIPAAFDAYIAAVERETGDAVAAGEVLVRLDDSEILLEKASLEADLRRFQAEAEQAQAEGRFAAMRVALAQADQTRATLDRVEFHLSAATLRSPFSGVLVEDGRLRERIGGAVSKGDILLRLSRMEDLYLQMDVRERDIHAVSLGAEGEIAFTSLPRQTFPIVVSQLDPAAITKEQANIFFVRAEAVDGPLEWWRPGMTGVAKIEAGRRTFFWMLTHRLVDWMHLKLWWW